MGSGRRGGNTNCMRGRGVREGEEGSREGEEG